MKYICSECGRKLEVFEDGETIEITPCEQCLGSEYNLGHEDGWENGYEAGYAAALNGDPE